ncbi:MAG: carboxypeptidase-like regulatory domain-containing protein, partial [Planctomycetaceae bacterium]|nr:carboxypeptidase-like regulatory domain-containing protein [Planctomycetaceae bacterium]
RTEYVEGNVTFNGQPLSNALVVFHPVNDTGVAANGTTNERGIFRLTSLRGGVKDAGAVAGEYRVSISREKEEPSSFREEKNAGGTEKIPVFESLIPLKYNDSSKSGLNATVEKKKNQFQFSLEK